MRFCRASLHPIPKAGLQSPKAAGDLPLGVDPVVPVHPRAREGARGPVGPVAPVGPGLAKVGAVGLVGRPVHVRAPGLEGRLPEVTELASERGNKC